MQELAPSRDLCPPTVIQKSAKKWKVIKMSEFSKRILIKI
jgi:hypothetical protein